MIYFYLSIAGLLVVAILFVLFPVLKDRKRASVELSNAGVIKQRIDELEQEVEDGLIDESEKEAAIRDLKIALVDETPELSTQPTITKKVSAPLLFVLALPALFVGGWVYWDANQISGLVQFKQSEVDVAKIRTQMQTDGGQNLTPDDFAKLALSIRTSLREKPNDAQGWSYLGLINTSIGRLEEGIAAYERALDISPQDDQIRFKYAETLMLAGSEDSLSNAKRQLNYLITKSPDNRNFRLLMTTIAIQLQEPDLALANFNLIKDFLRVDSQFYQSIVAGLQGLGIQVTNAQTNEESVNDNNSAQENLTSSVTEQRKLVILITIAPELQSKLPEDAYLIVFAQMNDGSSRAPLAVKKLKLGKLPEQVVLTRSDAMIPSLNIDATDEVKITARISSDEDVMPSKGELEGQINDINVLAVQGELLTLTINKELE